MLPHPGPYQIPAQTAAVARAAFPKGTLAMRLADSLGLLYEEADFAALYSATGRPGEDPVRLALVSIFQFLEGLSDRQAADAVRGRLDWKYALRLELTDPGFDYSVLSEFRARLLAGGQEQVLFDKVLAYLRAQGLTRNTGAATDRLHTRVGRYSESQSARICHRNAAACPQHVGSHCARLDPCARAC